MPSRIPGRSMILVLLFFSLVFATVGCVHHPYIVGSWVKDQVALTFKANGDIVQEGVQQGGTTVIYTGRYRWVTANEICIDWIAPEPISAGTIRVRLLGDTLILYSQFGGQLILHPS
jgi:hypothetical protein